MEKIIMQCEGNSFGKTVFNVDGKEISCVTGFVPVEEVLKLSNEPNVRHVDPKAAVLKKIEKTLTNQPEMMAMRNMGITTTADSCEVKNKQIFLNMKSIDGIINGGHTQYEIGVCKRKGVNMSKAMVPIRILESRDLTNRDIASISTALNDSSSPQQSTLLEKKGLAENMKVALRDNMTGSDYGTRIEWVENSMIGVPHMTLNEFIMLLNLMDVHTYGGYSYKKSKRVSKSVKGVVGKVNEEVVSYDYLAPIMRDIIELYDTITTSLTRMMNAKGRNSIKDIEILADGQIRQLNNYKNFGGAGTLKEVYTLFTEEPYLYNVNKAYLYVIISAFRANIKETPNGVEWVIPDVCKFFKSIERGIWEILVKNALEHVETNKDGSRVADASASTKPKSLIWDTVYNYVSAEVNKELLKKVVRN